MLPTVKTIPVFEMEKFKWLVYGSPKIGKTTFASQFKDALFLATEEGHGALSLYKSDIKKWEDLVEVVTELKALSDANKMPFKTIVIDTVDNLYDICTEFMCKKLGVKHLSDAEWGKGWTLTLDEFKKHLTILSRLGTGLIFISHTRSEKITFRGIETERLTFSLAGKPGIFINALCDIIAYVTVNDKQERYCYTKPTPGFVAGDRTNKLGDVIPFDYKEIQKQMEGK